MVRRGSDPNRPAWDTSNSTMRIAFRNLLRAPTLTATILITVGLGIGATTVIFSAVNAALLRPLPYHDPTRLVRIYTDAPPNKFRLSLVDYLALDAQQTQFERIAAYTDRPVSFSDGVAAERLRGREVTWTYLGLLGVTPAIGRDFRVDDAQPGGPPSAIVSRGFWQRQLGSRADVVGRTIRLDGQDVTIVGVLSDVVGPLEQGQDVFTVARWAAPQRRGPFLYTVIGRLRSGSSAATAATELHTINRRIFPLWRSSYQDEKATWNLLDLKTSVVGDTVTTSRIAIAAVLLVWLIACTNASNLLVSRIMARRRELAIRAALGASRARVVRGLLAESALLASGAGLIGFAIVWIGIDALRQLPPGYFSRSSELAIDRAVIWMLTAATAASAFVFGLIPAVHGSGGSIDDSLRSLGRSATGTRAVHRLRLVLVGGEFAIATPLLIIAALLLTSLSALGRVDPGFDTHNLLTGAIALPATQYSDPARVAAFWDDLHRRLAAIPGVKAAAFTDGRPPADVGNFNNFDLEDFPTPPGQSQPVAPWVSVSPDYFHALGLTLVDGRLFDDRDAKNEDAPVVVVDRAWARRFYGEERVVGKRMHEGGCTDCPWTTVVGVVSDVKYDGLNRPDEGSVYSPLLRDSRAHYVLLRTDIAPGSIAPAVRQVIRELDPTLPFSSVFTIDDLIARSLQRPRSLSFLIAAFAIVALVLSAVGIYGVMAHYVQQNVRNIAIRVALGGGRTDVLALVLGEGMRVVVAGVAAGVLAALFLTRLVSTLLFGVGATDGFTFSAASIALLAMALPSCVVPLRRAVSIAPGLLLRSE